MPAQTSRTSGVDHVMVCSFCWFWVPSWREPKGKHRVPWGSEQPQIGNPSAGDDIWGRNSSCRWQSDGDKRDAAIRAGHLGRGIRGAPRQPCERPPALSKSPRERAPVDEDVLTGDESGMRAGEKGAERAELGWIAESPGWDSRLQIGPRRIHAHAPLRRRCGQGRISAGRSRTIQAGSS